MLDAKQRRVELDVARTFAIICVVLCHATESIYTLNKFSWTNLSNQSRVFMILSFTIGRLGVPIFLFLTGALILKKTFEKDEDVFKFYKKNLLPLIIVNSIWIVIYNIFLCIYKQEYNVSIELIIKELLLFEKFPLPNMWYFPMIIGLYIGLPFISKIVKTFSKKSLSLVITMIFIYSFVLPMINTALSIAGIKNSYNSILNLFFLGGGYGLYTIVGYFLYNNNKKREKNLLPMGIAILCYIITCAFQMLSYSKISKSNNVYNVWYNFPFLMICAACIFKLILNIDVSKIPPKFTKFFTFISKTSLGIFFIHIIIQSILRPYINNLRLMMPVKVIILAFFNFIICIIINFLISKVKILSKYVLLIKN